MSEVLDLTAVDRATNNFMSGVARVFRIARVEANFLCSSFKQTLDKNPDQVEPVLKKLITPIRGSMDDDAFHDYAHVITYLADNAPELAGVIKYNLVEHQEGLRRSNEFKIPGLLTNDIEGRGLVEILLKHPSIVKARAILPEAKALG